MIKPAACPPEFVDCILSRTCSEKICPIFELEECNFSQPEFCRSSRVTKALPRFIRVIVSRSRKYSADILT